MKMKRCEKVKDEGIKGMGLKEGEKEKRKNKSEDREMVENEISGMKSIGNGAGKKTQTLKNI
jgi:hypothetical protein